MDAWKRAGVLTPKPGSAFKSQAGQQSRSPKAKVSGLFPERQVRSLGLGKPPRACFHMESPHSHPVRWAGWESPFSRAGEETEAQGGRRPGTPEGSEADQESGPDPEGSVFQKRSITHSRQGALFSSLTTSGDTSCFIWGQPLMSQGQNGFLPARGGRAAWIRNAELIGQVPSPGPPLAQATHLHTCGFSWGERLLPGSENKPEEAPSLCLVSPGVPATLQPPCKTQPRAASYHPGGCLLPTYFHQSRTHYRGAQRDLMDVEGRATEALCRPPQYTAFAPFFLRPPVKVWSWVVSASHCHLAQRKPTFRDQQGFR